MFNIQIKLKINVNTFKNNLMHNFFPFYFLIFFGFYIACYGWTYKKKDLYHIH